LWDGGFLKRENQKVLTRGLEPPRVAPYGPEPYASAIPPREQILLKLNGYPPAGRKDSQSSQRKAKGFFDYGLKKGRRERKPPLFSS
jgi:hypothetical protein